MAGEVTILVAPAVQIPVETLALEITVVVVDLETQTAQEEVKVNPLQMHPPPHLQQTQKGMATAQVPQL